LRSEPVKAGPPSASYRFRKFARRNAIAAGVAAVMAALVTMVPAGTLWQARVAGAERDRAVDESHCEHLARRRRQRERCEGEAAARRDEDEHGARRARIHATHPALRGLRSRAARAYYVGEAIDRAASDLGGDLDREPEVKPRSATLGNVIAASIARQARPNLERAHALRKEINAEAPETRTR
jgi:hypothetical protein